MDQSNLDRLDAQAARGGIKGKKNSADLAAPGESVVRQFPDPLETSESADTGHAAEAAVTRS
ncbi:MAG: hypothetical protein ACRD7E_30975, partial [Bryobacteraceae bacterium]